MSVTSRPWRSARSPSPPGGRRVAGAAAVAALVLSGIAATGPAAAHESPSAPPPPDLGWTAGETVTSGGAVTADARVGVAPDGTVLALWSQGGSVWTATRPAGGSWSVPGLLGAGTAPRLSVLPSGGAVAVWVTTEGGTAVNGMRRSPTGTWTALSTVPVSGAADPRPALDVAADGTAVLALVCGATPQVWATSLAPGETVWSGAVQVSAAAGPVGAPSFAVDPDGAGVVGWVETVGGTTVARVAERNAGGGFGAPSAVPPVGATPVADLAVDVGSDGYAAAAWTTTVDGHSVVRASVRAPTALWAPAATVSWADQESSRPDVAVGPGGVATVTWLTTSYGKVTTATSGPGGGVWSDVTKLAYYGGSPSAPDVVVAPDGTPWAAWTTNPATGTMSVRNNGGDASTVQVASRSLPRPVNLTPPRLSSPVLVDRVVTCLSGTWDKVGPQTWWAYWWLVDGVFLDGANARTYRPTPAQLGHRLQCKQKAGNGEVYTYAFSAPVVVGAGVAPANVTRPVPVGSPRVGKVLTCRVGTWSMRLTSVRVQWLRSGRVIRGATLARYRLASPDRGRNAACRVTAVRAAHRAGVAVSTAVRVR